MSNKIYMLIYYTEMCNMQILSDSNQGIIKSAFCKPGYNESGGGG